MHESLYTFASFRFAFPAILLALAVLWQLAIEPRMDYFRNRGDRFHQELLKAKFLFVAGAVLIILSELVISLWGAVVFGSIFIAFGILRLQRALRYEYSIHEDDNDKA